MRNGMPHQLDKVPVDHILPEGETGRSFGWGSTGRRHSDWGLWFSLSEPLNLNSVQRCLSLQYATFRIKWWAASHL